MAYLPLTAGKVTAVRESPSAKRQKTEGGYNSTSNSAEYNSEADSGEDVFQGIVVDTPPAKHFTQPTQIIDRSVQQSSPSVAKSPEVQIPASSPFRPNPSTGTKLVGNVAQRGRLANLMAPAGTVYKPPHGIVKPPARQPPVIIDISDDDGPEYKGGSSDSDGLSKAEIKPSTFLPKSTKSLFSVKSTITSGQASSRHSRFENIIAESMFNPTTRRHDFSSAALDRKNGDLTSPASPTTSQGKQAASSMSVGYRTQRKSQLQARPEMAMPVQDTSPDNESDEVMRRKIARLRAINPAMWSVLMCQNALVACKGNVGDAALMLTGSPIEISDNDARDGTKTREVHTEPQMKRQLNTPIKSIQERYSSTQHQKKPTQTIVATPPKKPRRRLVAGRRNPSSPVLTPNSPEPAVPEEEFQSDHESYDSGIASESEEDPALEKRVLSFLNKCTSEELAELANIKLDVAAIMTAQRPFKSLDTARQVLGTKTTKTGKRSTRAPIGEKIVQSAVDMMAGYEAVDALVAKCEELGKPLAKEISKWGFDVFGAARGGELEIVSLDDDNDSGIGTPSSKATSQNGDTGDDEIKTSFPPRRQVKFLKKPEMMNQEITLKDYQLVGLNWLALLYKHKLSCILADDMGLGKTCQVIAFLSHLAEAGVSGPHLVIVPPSTLENWLREFGNFSPDLVVEPYYGSQAERAEVAERILEQRDQINVVVSTYEFAAKREDNKFMRRLRPEVCVYDEGHLLKNPNSLKYKGLIKIPAQFRLLLTGTPLQNNLMELAALLGFILPEIFEDRQGDLAFIFKHKATTRDSDHTALLSAQRVTRAKSMLTPFVLRRRKAQVLKHMPPKVCRVEYCDLHPPQAVIYNRLLDKALERARLRLQGAKIPNDGENNPLMQLRKAAIHAMLFRRHFVDEKLVKMRDLLVKYESDEFSQPPDKILIEMQAFSDFYLHRWCTWYPCISKFDTPDLAWMDSGKVATLVHLLEKYKANGDRVLIFSQFTIVLDILESVLETTRIQFTRFDGTTKVNERQTLIDQFRDDPTITAFLLSTGAGGTGVNLMFANKVIIFDMSFNPQDDIQAENRAHRVGQTREVEVVRLVTRGTIEEQIYKLGQIKLALDSKVAGDEEVNGEDLVAKMLLDAESKCGGKEEKDGRE